MEFNIKLYMPEDKDYKAPINTLEFQAGLIVNVNGTNITQVKDSKIPSVFSDYIFRIIDDWLSSVPGILRGKKYRSELYDNPWAFTFKPIKNNIQIRFFYYGPDANQTNKSLLSKGKPYIIKKRLFIREIIKIANELSQLISRRNPSLRERPWFKNFETKIIESQGLLKEYIEKDKDPGKLK